jgi:hypothetical protein
MTGHHERPQPDSDGECCDSPETVSAPSPGFRFCPYRPLLWRDVPLLLDIFREPADTKFDQLLVAITALGKALSKDVKKLEHIIMAASQADIDAVTAALQAEDSALNAAVASLSAADQAISDQLAALAAANPALDLSALQAEVANSASASQAVADAVSATAALVPPAA